MQANEIATREFVVTLRGYDPKEVRGYLEEVAAAFERLSSTEPRSTAPVNDDTAPRERFEEFGRVTARILETVEKAAEDVLRDTETEAKRVRATAEQELSTARAEAKALREEAETLAASLREREDGLQREREVVDVAHAEAAADLHAAREHREAAESQRHELGARATRLSALLRDAAQELDTAASAPTGEPVRDDLSPAPANSSDPDETARELSDGHPAADRPDSPPRS